MRRSPSGPSRFCRRSLRSPTARPMGSSGSGGHQPAQPLPRRPSGRQGDKRARAILRDRSRCMDAVVASSSPRACGSRLRAPARLRMGTAAPRKRRGHLGSSSEHPVRFVIGTRDGSPSGGPAASPTGFRRLSSDGAAGFLRVRSNLSSGRCGWTQAVPTPSGERLATAGRAASAVRPPSGGFRSAPRRMLRLRALRRPHPTTASGARRTRDAALRSR